jgi:hypothetical protein
MSKVGRICLVIRCTLVSCSAAFDPEDWGNTFLRNVDSHTDYTTLYPRWQQYSIHNFVHPPLTFAAWPTNTFVCNVLSDIPTHVLLECETNGRTHYSYIIYISRHQFVCFNVYHYTYKECRLLGFLLSYILICRIWGFYGRDYEECRLLGCGAVWVYNKLVASIFRVEEIKPTTKHMSICYRPQRGLRSEKDPACPKLYGGLVWTLEY